MLAARILRGNLLDRDRYQLIGPGLGLILIVVPMLVFSSTTPHPSFPAVLPVAGTVLLVLFAQPKRGIGALLASKPFVAIGLISYSLYLWHYPAFAFLRLRLGEPSNVAFLVVIVVCLLLSWATYVFVEQPFRKRSKISGKAVFRCLSYGSVGLGMTCAVVINQHGNFGRFDHMRLALPTFEVDNRKLSQDRVDYNEAMIWVAKYRPGTGQVLVLGNSHAKDLFSAFSRNSEVFPDLSFVMYDIQLGCFDEDRPKVQQFFASKAYLGADMLMIAPQYETERKCHVGDKHWTNDLTGLERLLTRAKADEKKLAVVKNKVEFSDFDGKPLADALLERAIPKDADAARLVIRDVNAAYHAARYSHRPEEAQLNTHVLAKADQAGAVLLDREDFQCVAADRMCFGLSDRGDKTYCDYGHFTAYGAKFMGARMAELGWLDPLKEHLEHHP